MSRPTYNSYAPPSEGELRDWVIVELQKIARTFVESNAYNMEYRMPNKAYDGMTRLFDAVTSPDGTTGLFIYYENGWHRLG